LIKIDHTAALLTLHRVSEEYFFPKSTLEDTDDLKIYRNTILNHKVDTAWSQTILIRHVTEQRLIFRYTQ